MGDEEVTVYMTPGVLKRNLAEEDFEEGVFLQTVDGPKCQVRT